MIKKFLCFLTCACLLCGIAVSASAENDTAASSMPESVSESVSESTETVSTSVDAEGQSGGEQQDPFPDAVTGDSTAEEEPREGGKEEINASGVQPRPAFEETRIIDGVSIKVAAAEGVFPADSKLSVQQVASAAEQNVVDAAVEGERETNVNVAVSYTYDIKILDALDNEVQPDGEVSISFTMPENTNTNLDTAVYHIDDNMNATALDVEVVEDEATVTSDGFSYYTVEFTYNNKEYVLGGCGVIKLEELLEAIGLSGSVEAYEVSAPELFAVYRGFEDYLSTEPAGEYEVYIDDPEGDVLYLVSLEPFDTEEWLKVTLDGIEYQITVTDDPVVLDDGIIDIEGVEQGMDSTNFSQNIPIATIWIDESIINMERSSRDRKDDGSVWNVEGGLYGDYKGSGSDFFEQVSHIAPGSNPPRGNGNNFVALNLNAAADKIKDHKLTYDGEIARFTYPGAARDQNGNSLDVRISYSDLEIHFQKNITAADLKDLTDNSAICLWSANMADIVGLKLLKDGEGKVIGVDKANYGLNNLQQRYGAVWDTFIQVYYPEDPDKCPDPSLAGKKVEGTFYFPMVDIDVNRAYPAGGSDNFALIEGAITHNNYSEEVFLYRESVDPSSKIYIPGADTTNNEPYYSSNIAVNEEGWRFYPRPGAPRSDYLPEWDRSFYTGFLTLINNEYGMHTTNQFAGSGQATVETYFIVGAAPVQFRLKSSSTTWDAEGNRIGGKNDGGEEGTVGGRIQTTQLGNKDGTLTQGKVIDETTISTVVGQKVRYTMTPEPGYRLKGKVKVCQGGINIDGSDGGTVTEIEPVVVNDEYGFPKYYTFEFWQYSGINENNAIHVDWEPTELKVTKNIENSGHSVDDTFTFNIKIWDERVADPFTYSVTAYTAEDNRPVTYYSLEPVSQDDIVPGEYFMSAGGQFMGWDPVNKVWTQTSYDTSGESTADPSDELYTWTYVDQTQILNEDGQRIMQREEDYALVFEGGRWNFQPFARTHQIAWERSYNYKGEGGWNGEKTSADTPTLAGHYGIVNRGDPVVSPHDQFAPGENVTFYKKVVTQRRPHDGEPEWQHNVTRTKYSFTPVTQAQMSSDKTYIIDDGQGHVLGWDAGKYKIIRKTVDLANGTTDFPDINNYKFTYPGSGNRMNWAGNNTPLYVFSGYNYENILRVGQTSSIDNPMNVFNSSLWYNAADGTYRVGTSPYYLGIYELSTEEVTEPAPIDEKRDTFDFSSIDPAGLDPEDPADQKWIELLDKYEITDKGNGIFEFRVKDKKSGVRDPKSAVGEILSGLTVETANTGGKEAYDIAARLTALGVTPVAGKADTYQFTLTTENLTKSIDLNGIVPLGWKYTITEVGEDDPSILGTRDGWEFVSKSDNYTVNKFDGKEEVKFLNRINSYDLKVEKTTVDNKPGTFEYKVRIWSESGAAPESMDLTPFGGDPGGDGSYTFKIKNGENFTIGDILAGHKYEVQEKMNGRWELVSADGSETENNTLSKPGTYKVVVEDENALDGVQVMEDHRLPVRYRDYQGWTPSLVLTDESEKVFAAANFDPGNPESENHYSGTPQDPGNAYTTIATKSVQYSPDKSTVTITVEDKDGSVYSSGPVSVSKEDVMSAEHWDSAAFVPNVKDLKTITPTIRINGQDLTTGGLPGTSFQQQDNFTRLRTRGGGSNNYTGSEVFDWNVLDTATNSVTWPSTAAPVSNGYSSTTPDPDRGYPMGLISYIYPNAVEVAEGEYKDLVIRIWEATIQIPSMAEEKTHNIRGMHAEYKPTIFNIAEGPAVAGYVMGPTNTYPSYYNLSESVDIFLADDAGYGYEIPDNIKTVFDGTEYNRTNHGTTETPDWQINFNASINNIFRNPVVKPISVEQEKFEVKTAEFTIKKSAPDPDPEQAVTKDSTGKEYTFTLEDDNSFTIPDGLDYTAYKYDEGTGQYVPIKDTVVDLATARVSGKVKENITVSYKNELKPIVVEKTWDDENNAYGFRPSALDIELVTDVPAAGTAQATTKTYTQADADLVKEGNKWTYTFNNIPGDETVRSITETVPEHYVQTRAAAYDQAADKWVMENRLKKLNLSVTKNVTGNMGSRDKYFKFTIEISGPPNATLTLDMSNATTSFTGDGTEAPNTDTEYSRYMILTGTDDGAGNKGNARDDAPTGTLGQQIMIGANGAASVDIYLQSGQTAVLKGIIPGSQYTVTEVKAGQDGYKTTAAITGDDLTNDNTADKKGITMTAAGEMTDTVMRSDADIVYTNSCNGVIPTEIFDENKTLLWLLLIIPAGIYISVRFVKRRGTDAR